MATTQLTVTTNVNTVTLNVQKFTPSGGVQSVIGDGVGGTPEDIELTFPTPEEIGAQEELVSGTNIKTINGETLLGSGDIEIESGGGTIPDYTDIDDLTDNQGTQVENGFYVVLDASADSNITFPVGETKLQATYQYLGTPTASIADYRLISAPYGNHSNGGNGEFSLFNYIAKSELKDPLLEVSVSGWDQRFGEMGNMIKVGAIYIMVYSGNPIPYISTNSYIGLATSTDGENFTKIGTDGQIITDGNEDPYITYYGGVYRLYAEYKEAVPFRGIRLYTSTDLETWVDQGYTLEPTGSGWESEDVSSPVVKPPNPDWGLDHWIMYYEGRSPSNEGAIGLATSPDGEVWTRFGTNPIISGTNINGTLEWATHCVCDDVFKVGKLYYMTAHSYSGSTWREALLVSKDFENWNDALGGYIQKNAANNSFGYGLMVFQDGNEIFPFHIEDNISKIVKGAFSVNTFRGMYEKVATIATGAQVNTINSTTTGEPAGVTLILNTVVITQDAWDAAETSGTLVATTNYKIIP